MSKFVDERVVEMSFDNKRFESNVKTSMGTINKLKDSLDFSGTSKNINRELGGVNTNGISTALLGARSSFTAFEVASITAIANIANRVVDLGIKMASSLSIDQISSGWGKFGESAISEATLLAQGFEQADVTETLEKLLWYSDETSYSFTDMVDNMSKFTASGQGLEESSRAMMGIANWAALSGQNASVASRAMFQLSQAMSTGAVRLMDYKSIQTANMDTKEFRETVLSTAVAMGQLIQNVDGTYTTMTGKTFNTGQFTTELDELWFTSEVLMKSLDKYSSGSEKLYEKISEDSSINTASQAIEKYGDELGEFELKAFLAAQEARTFKDAIVAVKDAVASGWMNIFSKIFGSVAEAKILWTDLANSLYDVFMDGMWKKIDILSIWSENNGRDDLFANTEENTGAFWNLFNAIKSIKDLIGGAWKNVFGFSDLDDYDEEVEDIANKLKNLTSQLKDWSAGVSKFFRDPTEEMNNLVLDSAVSVGKAVKNIDGSYSDLEGNLIDTNEAIEALKTNFEVMKYMNFDLTTRDEVKELEKRNQTLEVFTNILTGVFSTLKIIGKTVIAIAKGFSPLIEVLKPAIGYLLGALGLVGKEITQFSDTTDVFEKITENLRTFFTTVIDFVKSLELLKGVRTFIEYFRESFNKVIGDVDTNSVKLISFRTIIDSISNVFKWFGEIISKYVLPFLPKFFEVFATGLGWIVGNIVKLTVSIKGIVIGSIEWFKTNERIQNGLLKLKNVLDVIGETFKKVVKNIADFFKSFGNSDMTPVEEFSGEVEEKFTPLKTFIEGLSNLFQGLWHVIKAIIPVIGAFFSFVGKALTFVGDKLKEIFTTGDGEVNFLKLFTVGFWAVVIVGIYRFADMLRSITEVFRDAFDSMFDYFNSKAMMQYMEAIKTMAISILLMVGALLILGSMDTGALKKSMIALGFLMAFMMGVLLLMKNLTAFSVEGSLKNMLFKGSDIGAIGTAFMGIAIAILILSHSLKTISKLDPEKMMYSLRIIALMMGMMVIVMKVVGKSEKGVNKAVRSMVKVAISVALLARPLKTIGSIDTDTGIRGLIGIASLMFILTMYSRFSKPIEKSQKSIYGLISTAVALTMLIVPLKVFGGMEWTELGKAGAAILGFFIIISSFSKIMKESDVLKLQSLSWSLITIAVSLTIFGRSMSELGSINFWYVARSLLTLYLVLTILATINKKLSKDLTKARMENMTRMMWSLIPLSIGMVALGMALKVLGSVDFWSAAQALATLAVVLLVLVGINKILSKDLTKPRMKNMSRMIWSLIPLSLGLMAFGLATRSISSIPWIKILSSLGVLSLILLTLVGVSKLLSMLKVNTLSLLGISASLITLSIGLIFFSTAILALGSIPITKLLIGMAAIAGVFAVLAIAGLLLNPLIGTLLALAATFIIFSIGVFLLVTALSTLVGIITISAAAFAAGLIAMSTAIVIAAPKIMEALWAILSGILEMVDDAIPMLMGVLETLIGSLLTTINTLAPQVLSTIVNLLFGILESIDTILPKVLETLVNLLTGLLTTIEEIFPLVTSTLMSLLFNLFDTLIENTPELVNKLVDLFTTTISSLRERLPEIMIEMALFIADFVDSTVEALILLIPRLVDAGFDLVIGIIDGVGESIVENAPLLRESMVGFAENMLTAFLSFFVGPDIIEQIKTIGKDMLDNIGKGIKEGWEQLKTLVNETINKIKGYFDTGWSTFKDIGKDMINGLIAGVNELWDGVKQKFEELANALPKWMKNVLGIKSPSTIFKDMGKDIINGLLSGVTELWDSVKKKFEELGNALPKWMKKVLGINSPSTIFKDIGKDIIDGLIGGITGLWDSVKKEIEELADALPKWMKKVLGIKSPSRVFAEIGQFIDMGLSKGIDDNSGDVYDSVTNLADEAVDGAKDSGLSGVLTNLVETLNSDFDNEIVIKPVLDLSEIQNGKGRLNSMMSDINSYDISGSNSIASRTRDEFNRDSKKLSDATKGGSQQEDRTSEVINNTFNITGANAKEIADEVSRVLQNQVDRRKAKWAL